MTKRILVLAAAAALLGSPAFAATPPASAPAAHATATAPAPSRHALYMSAQTKLKADGLYGGAITGRRDTATIAAIRRFQTQHHLAVSGRLTHETLQALGV